MKFWLLMALVFVLVAAAGRARAADETAPSGHHHETAAAADPGAIKAMSSGHMHMDAHMKWSEPRPQKPEDLARAEQIVATLRQSIGKYQDYRAAEQDGYRPFLPNVELPMYHFTNYWRGFRNLFSFDPARPTSLLYKKEAGGYRLIGAMYTAPRGASQDKLDARVPLSVARWHIHTNICLPPKGAGATADWTRFGPRGSIASAAECKAAGGRFYPRIFGWMVHVYPFEQTPEKIWAH